MSDKRKILTFRIIIIAVVVLLTVGIIYGVGRSFGFFKYIKKGDIVNIITIGEISGGNIEIEVLNTDNNALNLENAYPVYDSEGLDNTPFEFTVTNTTSNTYTYQISVLNDEEKQSACVLDDGTTCPELSTDYIRFAYKKNDGSYSEPASLSELNNIVLTDTIGAKEEIKYSIVIWIDSEAGNEIMNHYFFGKMIISQIDVYNEALLNGATPVLTNNLVPVQIADDGTVTKADIAKEWYSYENKEWANAVVLKEAKTYKNGETIPESNIDGYFVWIPRYRYEIFDEGNYTSATAVDSAPTESAAQEINIVFENKNTTPSIGTTEGTYLTHPAFTTLDVNGIWVAKFETSGSSSDLDVLPNETSLREINVKTMFESAYNYNRNLDSHMMKNTEWGAVAYLSHSKYGRCTGGECEEIRINNDSTFTTGCAATTPALNYYNKYQNDHSEGYYDGCENAYNTSIGYLASTTGNITGIYDMSGGIWEYMASFLDNVYGESGFDESGIALYDNKYFDIYSSNSTINSYNYRILGDATGELGPFYIYNDSDLYSRYHSTWYSDSSYFIYFDRPWFARGGAYNSGVTTGLFAFYNVSGFDNVNFSFRLVLAP